MLRAFTVAIFLPQVLGQGHRQTSCDEETHFRCLNGLCLPKARACNGKRECKHGEDELRCDSIASCRTRQEPPADQFPYYPRRGCRKSCVDGLQCRGRKRCICDDECGLSCVNPNLECVSKPPEIENSVRYEVYHGSVHLPKRRKENLAPYSYGAFVEYVCDRGYKLKGPAPRCNGRSNWSSERPICVDTSCRGPVPVVAHSVSHRLSRSMYGKIELIWANDISRVGDKIQYTCEESLVLKGDPPTCGENLQWTSHSVKCAIPCYQKRDASLIAAMGLICGPNCFTSSDCPNGTICHCDGPCSSVCVDPSTDCGEAVSVPNAVVTYTGSGLNKTARYTCSQGYYLNYGKLSKRCSGSGVWLGTTPVCRPVGCGEPGSSIRATQGSIYSIKGNDWFGAVVEFHCPNDYKMIGSPVRECMGNGQWSGELTVCDIIDGNEERCPHPGVPINGRLIGRDFSIHSTVRFQCDEGYVMYGLAMQECLWFREWSGSKTPKCIDPKYPHSQSNVVETLTRSLSNLPDEEISLGRRIDSNGIHQKHEIYFMFDISASVLKKINDLEDEIEFAKRLVRRMEGLEGSIRYAIIVFASAHVTALNIAEGTMRSDQVIQKLDQVFNEAGNLEYKNLTRSGTATARALEMLQRQIAFMHVDFPDNKRHVFIFSDGKHTEGKDPVSVREEIEKEVSQNVEFYSITACDNCGPDAHQELLGLATGERGENYIFIEDFYQLSTYLDKVTNVTLDFAECGQAGEVGSIKKQASLGRSVGGEDAAENAWPWQALIVKRAATLKETLSNKRWLQGGGSIINEHWILTAAHLLAGVRKKNERWKNDFAVSIGIFERPRSDGELKNSVQAYSIGKYFEHESFSKSTLDNDIALIRLGSRLGYNMTEIPGTDKGLTYGYYIRPVCLPCTGTCLTREHLINEDGDSLITDDMSDEQKCRVEEKFLLSKHAKAVVTGFGHLNISLSKKDHRFNPARKLQQALLKVDKRANCKDGIDKIANLTIEEGPLKVRFTKNMICFISGIAGKIVDACEGDSGGPVVREVPSVKNGNEVKKSCWVEVGVVSFGLGCGRENLPGYYTNVARYISWMNETTNGTLPGY